MRTRERLTIQLSSGSGSKVACGTKLLTLLYDSAIRTAQPGWADGCFSGEPGKGREGSQPGGASAELVRLYATYLANMTGRSWLGCRTYSWPAWLRHRLRLPRLRLPCKQHNMAVRSLQVRNPDLIV